ncbi:hypothetical protein [uncultured Veillonella sp.]|uniref:hypothetical protein n=1 Tax=uncultured Veillonella sp. TaxID=159268 RepID=UPI00280490C7|nr:hypothetical protein [uncultured Veillonella sp.]
MYEKIKTTLTSYPRSYYVIGAIVFLSVFCLWYISHGPSGADYQRTLNAVERAQKQQRESVELNRSVQRSIDRSTELSHEAKGRIERSTQYNHEIGERITNSQGRLTEARSYLERNAELFRRIEEQSRERQENYQTSTDATQPIPGSGSRSDNRNINSTMK